MDILRRWWRGKKEAKQAEKHLLTEDRVDFSLRIYWMKIATAQKWTPAKIAVLQRQAQYVAAQPDFEKNLMARRYQIEGLDNLAHSGASVLALLDVLAGLEKYHQEEDN